MYVCRELTLSGRRDIGPDALPNERKHRAFAEPACLDEMAVGTWLHQCGVEHLMAGLPPFGITQAQRRADQYPASMVIRQDKVPIRVVSGHHIDYVAVAT